MYRLMNAAFPVIAPVFFVVLIIFGSFFALNLLLAVLANSFEETRGEEIQEKNDEVGWWVRQVTDTAGQGRRGGAAGGGEKSEG
jgi:hypothetical protein